MRWLFNLSFRHKIPLWTSFLIGFSIFVVGAALMARAYEDMKSAVVISAENLGHTLANTVAPTLLHDDVWRAFEIVRSPIRAESARTPIEVDAVVVLTRDHKVFVSSHPDALPMLSEAAALGPDWARLSEYLGAPVGGKWPLVLEPDKSSYLYVALPITDKDAQLGYLILRYAKSVFHPWFIDSLWQGLGLGLLVLAVLIPINWYWGGRMAAPLVDLARRMGMMPESVPQPLPPDLYPYHDELGQLFQAYDRMVLALRDKAALESEVVKSERLAAIGQLAAGIAHEINNPLAGLITVVDTLKLRRDLDPRALRSLDLIDRGLTQIRDTVAALLVQTRVQARPLNQHDLEDIRTLIQPEIGKRRIQLDWSAVMPDELPAPASLVRQILINLLLNAVQAAGEGGHMSLWLGRKEDAESWLSIVVRNDGDLLGDEQFAHMFEPFASTRPGGHGLGLWVTYQIVTQLGGRIAARNIDGLVEFVVNLPLGEKHMHHRIGLIEDDPIIGEALSERLDFEGFACDWYRDGKSARRGLGQRRYSVVVSDINLPDISGEALFCDLLAGGQAIAPFIFITGYGAIDQAVRLLKLGAHDYVTKPFNVGELIGKIRSLCEHQQPAANATARLGISTGMRQIEGLLPRLAASRSAVLISGESGAGKEQVARALHRTGDPEGKTPFVAVNCGAIPENLIESELFGHEKGAFTGADRERHGVFEQADGGSLFLDEIGEMPPSMQVKLLRAIQDRAVVRVGGAIPRQVDIRLICATHHDLKALVEKGGFREDLYYRIHVIHLQVPPLRERQEDILWLAARFLDERASKGEARRTLTADAERALTRYPWPGNVRELQHCLERACVLSLTPLLNVESLFGASGSLPEEGETVSKPLSDHLQECERAYIRRALTECGGRIADTAALLGISRKNLWEKMRKLGMAET